MLHLVTKPSPAPSPVNSSGSSQSSSAAIPALVEWKSWLKGSVFRIDWLAVDLTDEFGMTSYAAGEFDPLSQVCRPATIAEETTGSSQDQFTILSADDVVDRSSEGSLLDFYLKKGYLPGPTGQHEEARLRTMRRYGLDQSVRRESMNRICSLAKAFFKTNVVIITLLFDDKQILAAESGWVEVNPALDEPLREIDLTPSLCTHAMLRTDPDENEVFLVPDASKDWRFKENPQTLKHGGGLAFYAAASISLPTGGPPVPGESRPPSPEDPDLPDKLPVGSICLVDSRPRAAEGFSLEDRQVLTTLAAQAAHEFQLGRESQRRATEAAQSQFLSAFVSNALINDDMSAVFAAPSTVASHLDKHQPFRPAPSPLVSAEPSPDSSANSSTETVTSSQPSSTSSIPLPPAQFQIPAESLCALAGASSAAILDVRAYQCPMPPPPPSTTPTGVPASPINQRRAQTTKTVIDGASTNGSTLGKIYLMGEAGRVDWTGLLKSEHAKVGRTMTDGLLAHYQGAQNEGSTYSGTHSPWADLLGGQGLATSVTPIFDVDGSPALIIVLTSDLPGFQFDPADRNFIEGVGAVAVGALVRQRAVQADQAKLSFVSQISHELRTPIHGVVSQVELIREFSSPSQLITLSPFLDVADICLESLRDVLDDVLDLGKLANQSSAEAKSAYRRALVKGDLAQLAEDVAKATWVRKRRTDLVSVDNVTGMPHTPTGKVDVILQVEDRLGGWIAWLDTGGMRRVLLNVLGNALKFTTKGHVKLIIREVPLSEGRAATSSRRKIQLIVADTGKGMSEEFLREGKLFTPFVQEDSFANGAGLGMSISLAIVERMGGKMEVSSALGEGTTMKITLPLEFCSLTPGVVHPHIHNYHSTSSPAPSRKSSLSREGITYTSRVISDELGALFDPGVGKLVTPFVEKEAFDFGAAVNAAQNSLTGTRLGRIPSIKRKVSRARLREMPTTPTREEADLVDEVAKLSVSQAIGSPARGLTPRLTASAGGTSGSYFHGAADPAVSSAVSSDPGWVGNASSLPTPTQETVAPQKPVPAPVPILAPVAASLPVSAAPDVKVLVADDNPLARNILTKLLSGKRVAFEQAADGLEAIERFAEGHGSFNLALIDVQMPRCDGIEAAFEMRKLEEQHGWPRARIIALTGLSTEQDMAKAGVLPGHSGPCDGWLVKGGKSLRTVMTEVANMQALLEAEQGESPEATPEGSPVVAQE